MGFVKRIKLHKLSLKMDAEKLQLMLNGAQNSLDRHQLTAAEKSFKDILADFKDATTDTQEQSTPLKTTVQTGAAHSTALNSESVEVVVQTLSGLTDIHLKRARSSRGEPLQWFRHYLHSVAYLQQIIKLCDCIPTDRGSRAEHWRGKYEQKLKEVSVFMGHQLESYVLGQKDGALCVRTEWLEELVAYLQKVKDEDEEVMENLLEDEAFQVEESGEAGASEDPKKNFPDFAKIHKALSKLVKNVSTDIRRRYRRKKLSEDTLRKSVSCELISILSPLNDDDDIMNLFEQIIREDEEEERWMAELNAVEETAEESVATETKRFPSPQPGEMPKETLSAPTSPVKDDDKRRNGGTPHHGLNDREGTPAKQPSRPHTPKHISRTPNGQPKTPFSSRPHTPNRSGVKHNSATGNLPLVATGALHIVEHSPSSEESIISSKYSSDELSGTNIHQMLDQPFSSGPSCESRTDDPCLLPGVLTVWKRYEKVNRRSGLATGCRPYRLPGFEEVSSLTEGSPCRVGLGGASAKEPHVLAVHPMEGTVLLAALAWQLTQLATILEEREHMEEAEKVLMFALGVIRQHRIADRGLSAVVYQRLGSIRINQSDLAGGIQLLEEARHRFESCDLLDWQIYCAEIMLEQGKAYLLAGDEPHGSQTLFDHVLQVVRERMNVADPGESVFELNQQCSTEEVDDSDSSQGESYALHVHEAAECFQSALSELQAWKTGGQKQGDPNHCGALMIDALVSLGDCHTMTGDFNRAVSAYEEALGLCKEVGGTRSLRLNAHILMMLGVANYLLGNLPKAAVMMETAHILRSHGSSVSRAGEDFESFFALCMLATTLYQMGQPHRCIVWCLRAYELFCQLYDKGDLSDSKYTPAPFIQQWFVLHCLLNLGHAYYTLDFYDKSEQYLHVALTIITESAIETDTRQHVRILKTLGDCRAAEEEHEQALEIYQDALDKASLLNTNEHASTSLQNQLLNSMAAVRVVLHQYHEAAGCLEMALDHQKQLESSIHGDLIGLEYQLGLTYMMSGEIDKSIDCFEDCLKNMPHRKMSTSVEDEGGVEVSPTHSIKSIGSSAGIDFNHRTSMHTQTKLGVLYHVKALMQEDNEFMEELLVTAKRYHLQAVSHNSVSSAAVHAANYLWQQGDFASAAEILMPLVFRDPKRYLSSHEMEVVFAGVGQAVMPEYLQVFADDSEEVVFSTEFMGMFIMCLCFKELKLLRDLTDVVVKMFGKARTTPDWTMLAFILMEIGEFREASYCFQNAAHLRANHEWQSFFETAICLSAVLALSRTILRIGLHAYLKTYSKKNKRLSIKAPSKDSLLAVQAQTVGSSDWKHDSVSDLDTSMSSMNQTSSSSNQFSVDSSGFQDSLDAGYGSNDSFKISDTHTFVEEELPMSQSSSEEEETWVVLEEGVQEYVCAADELDDSYSQVHQTEIVEQREEKIIDPMNENYQSTLERTVRELQQVAGQELNANYHDLYSLVDQQLRHNWATGQSPISVSKTGSENNKNIRSDRMNHQTLHSLETKSQLDVLRHDYGTPEKTSTIASESFGNQEALHFSPQQTEAFEEVYEKSQGYLAMFGPKRNLSTLESAYAYRPRKLLK